MKYTGVKVIFVLLFILLIVSLFFGSCDESATEKLVGYTDDTYKIMDNSLGGEFATHTRVDILKEMYNEIELKRKWVDENQDSILGNDGHIIMIGYYQTQVMILSEIKNQYK